MPSILKNRAKLISLWLPVLLLEILIFYLSSIPGLELTNEPVANFISRKAAHLFEYAALGFLIYRALGYKRAGWVLLLCFITALSDEFHQSLVPNRTAKVSDLLFDVAGVSLGLLAYDLIEKRKK